MNFAIQMGDKYYFSPIYNIQEQAFFTAPEAPCDFSIMIKGGYTSLDVSLISSTIYCVSGCNPQKLWRKARLEYPNADEGLIKVDFDFPTERGMGVDYATDWVTFYDKSSGVVCIRGRDVPCNTVHVEFTNNTVAGIYNSRLVSVWLKPHFVHG